MPEADHVQKGSDRLESVKFVAFSPIFSYKLIPEPRMEDEP